MQTELASHYTQVGDTKIHYRSAGEGEVILFLHGFPTSAYLWRNIMLELASDFQVIAIDLPAYGKSDKRLKDSYSFRYYERILSQFLENLGIDKVTLGVHDLGGPIGLYWLVQNMDQVNRLLLFNTLVYPQFSWAVKLFGLAVRLPVLSNWLTSPNGIKRAMCLGVHHKERLSEEIIQAYQAPFQDTNARKALLKSAQRLSMKGFHEIAEKLPNFKRPVQIIYGEQDKILPNVSATMQRVQEDLPQANIVCLPDCGHFLQEDAPKQIAEQIGIFMKQENF